MFPIKVKTTLDEKAMMKFNGLVMCKRVVAMLIVSVVMFTAAVAVLVWSYLVTGRIAIPLAIMTLGLIAAIVLTLLMPALARRSIRRSIAKQGETVFDCEFFEDHYVNEYSNLQTNGRNEFKYSAIIKAAEYNEYFFLFQDRTTALIVDKRNMDRDEVEALRGALKKIRAGEKVQALPQMIVSSKYEPAGRSPAGSIYICNFRDNMVYCY